MDREQREAARERCDKAIVGPWFTYPHNDSGKGLAFGKSGREQTVDSFGNFAINDAEFIAHARTDLPAALDHIETQEQRIEELENAVREIYMLSHYRDDERRRKIRGKAEEVLG